MKVNAAATEHPEFGLKRDLAGEIPSRIAAWQNRRSDCRDSNVGLLD
jgi:hypothetical protein